MILNVLSILGALLVFGVIVFVHELGHFASARLLGFGIDEFAIGFGPKLFQTERKGIKYSLRAVPLGGYVKYIGDEEEDGDDPRAFYNQKPWKRLVTIFMGAFMNIVFALLLAALMLSIYGSTLPKIVEVTPNTPAETAGLLPDDVIEGVNGKKLAFYYEFQDAIAAAEGTLTLSVLRDGQQLDLTLSDFYDQEQERNVIGIVMDIVSTPIRFNVFEATGNAFKLIGYYLRQMYDFIANIFNTPNLSEQFMGPVGVISVAAQAVRLSFESILSLAILISINLAVFNWLPIPGLDGMRMVFVLIEMIAGKPVPRDKEALIHAIGVALLFAFILFITFGDIRRLFGAQ